MANDSLLSALSHALANQDTSQAAAMVDATRPRLGSSPLKWLRMTVFRRRPHIHELLADALLDMDERVIEFLVDSGADPYRKLPSGFSVLEKAALEGKRKLCAYCLAAQ